MGPRVELIDCAKTCARRACACLRVVRALKPRKKSDRAALMETWSYQLILSVPRPPPPVKAKKIDQKLIKKKRMRLKNEKKNPKKFDKTNFVAFFVIKRTICPSTVRWASCGRFGRSKTPICARTCTGPEPGWSLANYNTKKILQNFLQSTVKGLQWIHAGIRIPADPGLGSGSSRLRPGSGSQ